MDDFKDVDANYDIRIKHRQTILIPYYRIMKSIELTNLLVFIASVKVNTHITLVGGQCKSN